ncbi:ras-related protein Rab-31-like [Tubulanus polymorphus]|uniref:ras-related protein Rab-31-like n=1 Tax=Tubulanus polymorphus TaxID=672921 RepID=UPI003DA2B59B
MSNNITTIEAKIVVLGSQGVGKTSLVVRYVSNAYNHNATPTIGASFFTCKLAIDSYRVKLQVWDTAGQERFRAMAPMYYRKANAAFLVFDLTSAESFEDVKTWVKELKRNIDGTIAMCVLGNKNDLENEREVPKDIAQDYATSIGALYFETSALENNGIQDAFMQVALRLITLCETQPNNSGMKMLEYAGNIADDSVKLRAPDPAAAGATPGQQATKSSSECCSS